MRDFNRIILRPGAMGGEAFIRGLRVTVGMIVGQLGAGRTIDSLLGNIGAGGHASGTALRGLAGRGAGV